MELKKLSAECYGAINVPTFHIELFTKMLRFNKIDINII